MPTNCVHGMDPRWCTLCERSEEQSPLPGAPLRATGNAEAVLVLRPSRASRVKVLTLDGLSDCDETQLQSIEGTWRERPARESLLKVAAERGFLFVPPHPLTSREQQEDLGPTHCYHCRVQLSNETGSLGCTRCRYYVCRCERCLCGYTGTNWQGQLFSQFPALPISREDRLEYVRAFRFLKAT